MRSVILSKSHKTPLLLEEAKKIINSPIPLITDKDIVPPSGNKNDFLSLSPYHNLDKDGKLVYKDGEINPKTKDYPDSENLDTLTRYIFITSLAAKLTEDQTERERLAHYAVSALKAWFVDDQTKMTPALEYAQMKPGEEVGNFWGIIEGSGLIPIIDGIKYLKEMGLIDAETLKGVEDWFKQYLNWLLTSEKGIKEKAMPNNHGTFYDLQVASIADLFGQSDLVISTITEARERIKIQINPDGKMPRETSRVASYDYQLFNLYALCRLALLG